MCGIYYPKNNLLLIDGTKILQQSLLNFLDKIYILKLYEEIDNSILIPVNKVSKKLLLNNFTEQFLYFLNKASLYIKQENIYCNICICFCTNFLDLPHEIYNYIDKHVVTGQYNSFCKKLQKKYNIYTCSNVKIFHFKDEITTNTSTKGKIHEILNTINFKILKKA